MSFRCKIGWHDWRQVSPWRHWIEVETFKTIQDLNDGEIGSACDCQCDRCGKETVLSQAWDCGMIQLYPEKIPDNIGGKPFRIRLAV